MGHKPDVVIVGAGIVGLTLARALAKARPELRIVVLEKEALQGAHASGRNSGVVHAGIYYTPGSLKARLCTEGSKRLLAYCHERALPVRATGKVIIPTKEGDFERLDELHRRGPANGVRLEMVDRSRLLELEPAAASAERALYSPNTASINPQLVLDALVAELGTLGVTVTFGVVVTAVDAKAKQVMLSTGGRLDYGFLLNAAGSHADRLAHAMGVGSAYVLLPFRGGYYELSARAPVKIRRQVYPVPDPELPFLGVHMTVTVSGKVYVGPTARPVLGREHYGALSGIDWGELPGQVWRHAELFLTNRGGFRRHALVEVERMMKSRFVEEAQRLIPAIRPEDLLPSKKVGIRAQLYDTVKRELVMDFLVEQGPSSLHVLNAVSPGFTAAFAFADELMARSSL